MFYNTAFLINSQPHYLHSITGYCLVHYIQPSVPSSCC